MPSPRLPPDIARLEQSIEAKRRLLDYVRSRPQHMTIESYVCLANLLGKAGWTVREKQWFKNGRQLALLDAARLELDEQIEKETAQVLRITVPSRSA